MAKKRGWFRKGLVLCVLGLAAFGGWTLYQGHKFSVDEGVNKVAKKAKAVSRALKD